MNAMLLIILLAHGGYWYGGVDNTIAVKWAVPEAKMPAATLSWQLMYQTVVIASGKEEMAADDKATTLTLKLPEARAMSGYVWKYQLTNAQTGKELESGERAMILCPPKLLQEQAKRTRNKSIVVIDAQDAGLTAMLKEGGVDATRVATIGELQLRPADIILVAENQMPDNDVTQEVLRTRAREGAQVMILAQPKIKQMLGFALATRPIKDDLVWQAKHEMFGSLPPARLNEWAREYADDVKAVRLPADAPVLELCSWRRETPGDKPVPIDALVATQTVGTGRILFWQIPLAGFKKEDPRPQIVLANALDYLLTRPEPTLPPSQRVACPKAPQQVGAPKADPSSHTITGDMP